ncbi:MAG TPA: peptidase dimerization domain-containing protein [Ktedonobacteraceae bacterium]|nr:peptidase dimerization domain-containing protein [Ktedonobacteraceae bacterium]
MHSSEERELFTCVESQLPHYLAEAEAWLATTNTDEQSGILLQDAIDQQLQQRGLFPEVLDREKSVLCTEKAGATSPTLLLYYHYDRTENARGLLPFLASLAVLDLYHRLDRPLPINVKWLIDGSGARKFFPASEGRASLAADYILWHRAQQATESAPSLALGVKGYLSVSLSVETAAAPLASSYGAVLPNAAWRLLWALNSLKTAHEDILIEGFYDTLVPADDQLLEDLYTLPVSLLPDGDQAALPPYLLQLHGFQLHYAHLLLPTCSIIRIESQLPGLALGNAPAHLPQQAQAQVDFYLVPAQDPEDIFAKVQQHLQQQDFPDIVLQQHAASYAASIPLTHPFVTSMQETITLANGTAPNVLPLTAENFPFASSAQIPPLLVYTLGRMTAKEDTMLDAASYASAIKQLMLLLERLGREQH